MQQDASECWTELMTILSRLLRQEDVVNRYFRGKEVACLQNTEAASEPSEESQETFLQLNCNITPEVKYVESGLRARMTEKLTKRSPILEKDCLYEKTKKLTRLPAYLCVEFVRFFYKEKEGISAKILKDVKFPMVLDTFEFCAPDLIEKLVPMRDRFKAVDDEAALVAAKKGEGAAAMHKVKNADVGGKEIPFSFPDDPGSNNSGLYELMGVLTHQGRSSSSGHYVAWVRRGKIWCGNILIVLYAGTSQGRLVEV